MLVVTRKIGQAVLVAGNIKITVNKVNGLAVSLAIDAPKDVQILREEVSEAKREMAQPK